MALHHATLKAAVSKYLPLVEEGKTEEEIKAAISADEKAFDAESVDEIFSSLTKDPGQTQDPEAEKARKKKYIVKSEFRDIDNFNLIHEVGDDLSHLPKERLDRLEQLGLV